MGSHEIRRRAHHTALELHQNIKQQPAKLSQAEPSWAKLSSHPDIGQPLEACNYCGSQETAIDINGRRCLTSALWTNPVPSRAVHHYTVSTKSEFQFWSERRSQARNRECLKRCPKCIFKMSLPSNNEARHSSDIISCVCMLWNCSSQPKTKMSSSTDSLNHQNIIQLNKLWNDQKYHLHLKSHWSPHGFERATMLQLLLRSAASFPYFSKLGRIQGQCRKSPTAIWRSLELLDLEENLQPAFEVDQLLTKGGTVIFVIHFVHSSKLKRFWIVDFCNSLTSSKTAEILNKKNIERSTSCEIVATSIILHSLHI